MPNENISSAPLLPCPFCGSAAYTRSIEGGWCNASCQVLQCQGYCFASTHATMEEAIAAWNARAPQAVAAQAAPAAPDANRLRAEVLEHASKGSRLVRTLFNEPTGTLSDVEVGDWIQRAQQYLTLAAPALPATEDSSAGDLAEVQAEPVAWMDDGSLRSGSTATAHRVVTAATKAGMPRAASESFNTPLYAAPQAQPAPVQAEPVMIYHGRCTIDCGEHGHHDVEMLKMIPAGAKLYTAHQAQPADALADPIRQLIHKHAALLAENESAYFELCYHRVTGWMAWITDRPLCMPTVINPGRNVIAQGQGDTAEEACSDAMASAQEGGQS